MGFSFSHAARVPPESGCSCRLLRKLFCRVSGNNMVSDVVCYCSLGPGDYNSFATAILSRNNREIDIAESL